MLGKHWLKRLQEVLGVEAVDKLDTLLDKEPDLAKLHHTTIFIDEVSSRRFNWSLNFVSLSITRDAVIVDCIVPYVRIHNVQYRYIENVYCTYILADGRS